jgi:uncharacterized RDD family membrane protein YckC
VPGRDPLVSLLRRRTWAGWIDVLVLFIVGAMVSVAAGQSHIGSWTTTDNGFVTQHSGFSVALNGGPFFIWVGIALLYYFIAELATGQTIGKGIMGLKVIAITGGSLGPRHILLRTVGRIVDVLPAFYLVGWIAMRGPRKPPQRLGDRVAGTTVVPLSHP